MPTFSDELTIECDPHTVWAWVKDVDNWAHLFPGYQRHLLVEEDHYFWQLRGETGAWSRLVEFDVRVTEWSDPDHVVFELQARSEPVTGTGRFFTRSAGANGTIMGFELATRATGVAAPMINALLKKFVDEASRPFLEALGAALAAQRDRETPAPALTAGGSGVVIVEYRAPRTEFFDRWWRDSRRTSLRQDPWIRGFQRLERPSRDGMAEYLELLESRDAAATVAAEVASAPSWPDVELLRPPYAARRINRDRPSVLAPLFRLRRRRRSRRARLLRP